MGEPEMKTLFFGLAAVPLLASVAFADGPAPLSDRQMDNVTAGHVFSVFEESNKFMVWVDIDQARAPGAVAVSTAGAAAIDIIGPYSSLVVAFKNYNPAPAPGTGG
jgi:hypothetical protein